MLLCKGELVIVPRVQDASWPVRSAEGDGLQPHQVNYTSDHRQKFCQPGEKVGLAIQQIICTRDQAPAPCRRHQEGVVKHDFAAAPPQFGGVFAFRL